MDVIETYLQGLQQFNITNKEGIVLSETFRLTSTKIYLLDAELEALNKILGRKSNNTVGNKIIIQNMPCYFAMDFDNETASARNGCLMKRFFNAPASNTGFLRSACSNTHDIDSEHKR